MVYDKNSEKIKAIGEEARQMTGHVSSNMEVIRPIRQGVIVDYTVMEKMLKYFISRQWVAMPFESLESVSVSPAEPQKLKERQ